jgi:hypothetical protein
MVSCLEAVNHPTLLVRSILDVLKVFEHLHMLWMDIWVHPYTVTSVPVVGNIAQFGVMQSPNNTHYNVMF